MVDWLLWRLILGTCKCFQSIFKLFDCIFDRSMLRSYNIWMQRGRQKEREINTRRRRKKREVESDREREREHCSESENCRGLGTCLISWQRITKLVRNTQTFTYTYMANAYVCVEATCRKWWPIWFWACQSAAFVVVVVVCNCALFAQQQVEKLSGVTLQNAQCA